MSHRLGAAAVVEPVYNASLTVSQVKPGCAISPAQEFSADAKATAFSAGSIPLEVLEI